ncbi:MAG: hypothetical protein J1G05_00440 [Clostridiales bacterium]|nr:hypothetical protein [Clostridiales bacterium]
MKKIIIKTAIITFASVVAALALAFGIASLAFPQGMSKICENMGNYKLAASYAERQYGYSGSTEDLYRCALLHIRIGDRNKIIEYCGKLVEKQDFEERCGDNVQYVYGNYATALYLSGKDDEAIAVADKSVGEGFHIPNAYADLTVKVVEKSDKDFASKLLGAFVEHAGKLQYEEQLRYFNAVKNSLEELIG